jgi:hypothetical protein
LPGKRNEFIVIEPVHVGGRRLASPDAAAIHIENSTAPPKPPR